MSRYSPAYGCEIEQRYRHELGPVRELVPNLVEQALDRREPEQPFRLVIVTRPNAAVADRGAIRGAESGMHVQTPVLEEFADVGHGRARLGGELARRDDTCVVERA